MVKLILVSFIISLNIGHSEMYSNNIEFESKEYLIQNHYNESQLIGKWYFLSNDHDNKSKTQNLLAGKFIIIKSNYMFKSDVFENIENGNWSFEEKTQILTFKTGNKNSKWKLQKVNDFGMVLINAETSEKWMFAAE
jgi:hypothetical protein